MTRRRALLLSLLLLALVAAACGKKGQEEAVERPDIMGVVDAHAPRLIAIPGVAAVAVGALDSGEPCVRIYVVELTDALRAQLPATLDGWPVDVEESGEIRPLEGG
ncbi:MAG: hypothetical protein ABR506_03400 [Candidatus Krumholzibacteriia bacterium]